MQKQAALTDLQGLIERITYFDEESGYTIAKVRSMEARISLPVSAT